MIIKRNPYEAGRVYDEQLLDITGAKDVEVLISRNMSGFVLHVNVDGVCTLRICRIKGTVKTEDRARNKEQER